jgi:hypothetical protein
VGQPHLWKNGHPIHNSIVDWCQGILEKKHKTYNPDTTQKHGLTCGTLDRARFYILGILKLVNLKTHLENYTWSTVNLPLSRALSIITITRHAVTPFPKLIPFTRIFKSVDIDALIDKEPTFSTYIIASSSGNTYVGLIGLKRPCMASERWKEHASETNKISKGERNTDDGVLMGITPKHLKARNNKKYSTRSCGV